MNFVILRRAGGSLTLTIPAALARTLGLQEGARMKVAARAGKLIAEPSAPGRPRYVLEDLIAQCDGGADLSEDDQAWLDDGRKGNELI